jgi:predicted SprT family Zn-dependent metalloprotease
MSKISSVDFENLVLTELAKEWRYNRSKFGWDLKAPTFRLFDRKDRLGQWDETVREISISRSFITDQSWNEVLEVLKHEMAHQYVSEALHITDEDPHGQTFQNVCKNNKIDAARAGTPGAHLLTTTNHIVEKVRHLLQLASNAGATEAEAQAAAEAAHNMMLKYNITVQEKNEAQGYTVRYLGENVGRIQAWMSELAFLMSKYYFTEIIWISTWDPRTKKHGMELEVSGTVENLDVVEYVHEFISREAIKAWEVKFKSEEFKDEMDWELNLHRTDAPQSAKGYTISARSNFLLGFVRGFKSQLKQAEIKETSAGLVLARDPALEEFYKSRHPHIRNLKGSRGFTNHTWQNKGFSAGASLKIPAAAKAAGGKSIPLLNK